MLTINKSIFIPVLNILIRLISYYFLLLDWNSRAFSSLVRLLYPERAIFFQNLINPFLFFFSPIVVLFICERSAGLISIFVSCLSFFGTSNGQNLFFLSRNERLEPCFNKMIYRNPPQNAPPRCAIWPPAFPKGMLSISTSTMIKARYLSFTLPKMNKTII